MRERGVWGRKGCLACVKSMSWALASNGVGHVTVWVSGANPVGLSGAGQPCDPVRVREFFGSRWWGRGLV